MKAEHSQLISRKPTETLVLLSMSKAYHTHSGRSLLSTCNYGQTQLTTNNGDIKLTKPEHIQ